LVSFLLSLKPEGPNGYLGNWFPSYFLDEVGHNFPTSEHYMMCRKALLMGDDKIAGQVLRSSHPNSARQLGRKVRGPNGWDRAKWIANREKIMIDRLIPKFRQNAELREKLLATDDKILVEASPRDRIWGIGISAANKDATHPERWKGQNLLGKCLMEVRALLRSNQQVDE